MLHHHKIVHRDIKAANVFFAKGIGAEGEFLLFERFAELEMEQ